MEATRTHRGKLNVRSGFYWYVYLNHFTVYDKICVVMTQNLMNECIQKDGVLDGNINDLREKIIQIGFVQAM